MTINALVAQAYANSKAHGFYDADGLNIPEKLALIHSEISEALECFRSGDMGEFWARGKPEGFAVELADAVIRIADLCGRLDIDLEGAIQTKMKYNAGRPYKHGKAC